MTDSDVLFDTWAWWEYLHRTRTGEALRDRYVAGGTVRIHTSAISLGELSGRLHLGASAERIARVCGAVRRMSHVWDVTADIAQEAGPVRTDLRRAVESASLADAIILVTARKAGARLVSADPAFRDVDGVVTG